MIRGVLLGPPGRVRPFVTARLVIPSVRVGGDVDFLIDTGADSITLAPRDASYLGLDVDALPQGPSTTGVGDVITTVQTEATITLDHRSFSTMLRILAPGSQRQQAAMTRIPSLFGRDLLAHFALFFEEHTGKVLLLDPNEADALGLR
jgi:hypothetical protein